ncbi:Arm DNA-binding domain-containing protein [Novosphingobium sp. AAP1]|uniref:Arm DNA-binding domain-containing protein n=1 Tax=Novosphingobium sp. AAP1 TaxID=1523413 RepID=UPI000A936DBD|nr:Arm DNA-binding domain-containing protein [Novosphingobium sp. AAP1]
MKQHILSHIAARNAPPGRYGDGAGLWLHKRERARGKWVLRYFLKGRRREMGLGPWPDVSIADARAAARKHATYPDSGCNWGCICQIGAICSAFARLRD